MKFFFFNDTATTEIYTLSLHDALPIYRLKRFLRVAACEDPDLSYRGARLAAHQRSTDGRALDGNRHWTARQPQVNGDRKSTRLNSSHANISYAVFCLKKKI